MLVIALKARSAVVAHEATLVVTLPAHRPPAVTLVFVVIAAARARPAFTHEAAIVIALRTARISPILVFVAAARVASLAREAALLVSCPVRCRESESTLSRRRT